MEQELYLKIPTSEAVQLAEHEGFMQNAFPYMDNDQNLDYYFVSKSWYDHVNYLDYLDSLKH